MKGKKSTKTKQQTLTLPSPGVPGEGEEETCRLIVNDSLTLAGIPMRALDYRLGNRSALEWVVDQYQVSEDTRSKIVSDPNRDDDEEYIVRLVGQVVRVSMETNNIIDALPAEFSSET